MTGNKRIVEHLSEQRDLYRYINDQRCGSPIAGSP
jgi:alkyl sulfatase BDS1-like metallo-beta-lactamase superfamily hydrolase